MAFSTSFVDKNMNYLSPFKPIIELSKIIIFLLRFYVIFVFIKNTLKTANNHEIMMILSLIGCVRVGSCVSAEFKPNGGKKDKRNLVGNLQLHTTTCGKIVHAVDVTILAHGKDGVRSCEGQGIPDCV